MNDLVSEIKEDIANERFLALWSRFGYHIIAFCVVVVFATGGGVYWSKYQQGASAADGDAFYRFAKSQDIEANAVFDASSAFSSFVAMREAGDLVVDGKKEDALRIYQDLEQKAHVPGEILDVSYLLRHYLGDTHEHPIDTLPYSVKEYKAFDVLNSGNYDDAKALFLVLVNDVAAPSNIRRRAAEMVSYLP